MNQMVQAGRLCPRDLLHLSDRSHRVGPQSQLDPGAHWARSCPAHPGGHAGHGLLPSSKQSCARPFDNAYQPSQLSRCRSSCCSTHGSGSVMASLLRRQTRPPPCQRQGLPQADRVLGFLHPRPQKRRQIRQPATFGRMIDLDHPFPSEPLVAPAISVLVPALLVLAPVLAGGFRGGWVRGVIAPGAGAGGRGRRRAVGDPPPGTVGPRG